MIEDRDVISPVNEGTPRWLGIAVVVLAGVSLLALGIGWSASNSARTAEQSLANEVKPLRQNVEVLTQRLTKAEETNAQLQGEFNVVTDRLQLTQGELQTARRQSKQYSKKLSTMEASVKGELATKASADDVKALSGDVSGVRSDLEATKQNLQMSRGELGTLIARNHEEIEQLRRMGQRDYFEFTLEKKGTRQRVGSLMVELRGTNAKRNHFTIALYVDDMRLEKKNRSVNEPIYFYTRGARAALELVVNHVGKDRVVGYLSIPKSVSTATSGN